MTEGAICRSCGHELTSEYYQGAVEDLVPLDEHDYYQFLRNREAVTKLVEYYGYMWTFEDEDGYRYVYATTMEKIGSKCIHPTDMSLWYLNNHAFCGERCKVYAPKESYWGKRTLERQQGGK